MSNTSDYEPYAAAKAALLEALEQYEQRCEHYDAVITARLKELTALIEREHVPSEGFDIIVGRPRVASFNRCIEYINRHYRDDISLERVSGVAGFSKFHFTRWFKQLAGMSFYEYLTRVRIRVAEIMLASSEAPITEIALESGFQSIATFNRVFKTKKKITPTAYRRSAGEGIESIESIE